MTEPIPYSDETPAKFPNDYDKSKVDSRIKLRSKAVIEKVWADDTQQALAQGIEIAGAIAGEGKQAGLDAKTTADNVNNRFDLQINKKIDPNETIDFRYSDMLAKAFGTAKLRGDFMDQELRKHGLNIEWFGAVGDGATDSTQAMTDAIAFAQSNGIDRIFVPDGVFALNPTTPYVITNITVTGKSKYTSKILTTATLFDVATYGIVETMTIEKTVNDAAPIINVGGKKGTSLYGIRLKHLHLGGTKTAGADVKECLTVGIKLNLANMGVWDTHISDIEATYVYSGLQIDATDGGWMTGCDFQGLTKQFSHSAMEMVSSNSTMQNGVLTMSKFSWMGEVSGTTPDAVGFIIAGSHNIFTNMRLFQDGTYSGIAIQLTNQSNITTPSTGFGGGRTSYNTFEGGHLEGRIDDPIGLYGLQYWHDVMLIGYYNQEDDGTDDMSSGHPMMMQTTRPVNLISQQTLNEFFDPDKIRLSSPGIKYSTGIDQHGRYLEVDAADATSPTGQNAAYVYLPSQTGIFNALSASPFTIGVKVSDLGGTIIKGTDSPVRGYLVFNGQQVPRTLSSQGFMTTDPSDSSVKSLYWNYESQPDWFTTAKATNFREAFVQVAVDNGSHVRIYDVDLALGYVSDLSLVQNNASFNLPIAGGGRNYLKSSDISIEGTGETSITARGKSCIVDVSALNLQKSKYLTISADVDVTNWVPGTNTGRFGVYAEVILKLADGSSIGLNCGVLNQPKTIIRGRVSAFFFLPEQQITSATAVVGVTGGGSADYYYIGHPQLETGTVMSDWRPAAGE